MVSSRFGLSVFIVFCRIPQRLSQTHTCGTFSQQFIFSCFFNSFFTSCPIISLLPLSAQKTIPTYFFPLSISCIVRVFLTWLDNAIMEVLDVQIISSQAPNTKWITVLHGEIVSCLLRWCLDVDCLTFFFLLPFLCSVCTAPLATCSFSE